MTEHSLLHKMQIARCNTNWDEMAGSELVRECPTCKGRVFNPAQLDENQLLEFIQANAPELESSKLKLFRRGDGKLMVEQRDCTSVKRIDKIFAGQTLIVLALGVVAVTFNAATKLDDHMLVPALLFGVLSGSLAVFLLPGFIKGVTLGHWRSVRVWLSVFSLWTIIYYVASTIVAPWVCLAFSASVMLFAFAITEKLWNSTINRTPE